MPVSARRPEHAAGEPESVGGVRVSVAIWRVQHGHLEGALRHMAVDVEAEMRAAAVRRQANACLVVADVHLFNDGHYELLHLEEVHTADAAGRVEKEDEVGLRRAAWRRQKAQWQGVRVKGRVPAPLTSVGRAVICNGKSAV